MRTLGLSELNQISGGLQANSRSASLQRPRRQRNNALDAGRVAPDMMKGPGSGGYIGYGYGYVVDSSDWYGEIYGGGYATYNNGYSALASPAYSVLTIPTSSGYTVQATPTYDIANHDWAVGVEIQGPNFSATAQVDANLQGGELDVHYQVPGTDVTVDGDLKMQNDKIKGAGVTLRVPFN